MDNKTDLRIRAKALRKTLDIKKISVELIDKLRKNIHYCKAKNIMLYYPKNSEIDLRDLFSDSKNFYLPRVKEDMLEVCPYSLVLKKSKFGVMEPVTAAVTPDILDLIIVPALMADSEGYRLGYGGGFYDRFLTQNRIHSICLIARELFVEALPHDNCDVKVDEIIF